MPRVFIVMLPVGMGKTRLVWRRILWGAKSKGRINQRIRDTLICGPNSRVEEVWLRELALLLKQRRLLYADEHDIRKRTDNKLASLLDDAGFESPDYLTYRQLAGTKRRAYKHLVLDEWHKIPRAIQKQCEIGEKWYLRPGGVRDGIYFVSATPVNPVLEEDQDRTKDGEPASDEEFTKKLSEGRRRAFAILRAFCRVSALKGKDDLPFKDFVRKLGAELYPNNTAKIAERWQLPDGVFVDERENMLEALGKLQVDEIAYFPNRISNEEVTAGPSNSWSEEYAYAAGLIRTAARRKGTGWSHKIVPTGTRAPKRCFGKPYATLHSTGSDSMDAARWLVERHHRVGRLLSVLQKAGVAQKNGSGDGYSLTKKKALIFCVHQGVCVGLTYALRRCLGSDSSARKAVANTISTHDEKSGLRLDKRFNEANEPPFILITTDAYSESVDLHGNCNLLFHYELPWSPLRLFQRIGRLTRLKSEGDRTAYNRDVRIGHIVMPGSVEEERVNRLHRRIHILHEQDLWPRDYRRNRRYGERELLQGLLGDGPSLHYRELLNSAKRRKKIDTVPDLLSRA